jgi:hypothetical protein
LGLLRFHGRVGDRRPFAGVIASALVREGAAILAQSAYRTNVRRRAILPPFEIIVPGTTRLKPLVDGLYYPAVLGAGFLALLTRLALRQGGLLSDVSFWLAVVLVVFFSASYLATHAIPEDQYGVTLLLIDLLEIAALSGAFAALGFADLTEPRRVHLSYCYGALLCLLAVDFWWYWAVPKRPSHHWWRWVAALVSLCSGLWGSGRFPWMPWAVTVVLAIVAVEYIVDFGDLLKRLRWKRSSTGASTPESNLTIQ